MKALILAGGRGSRLEDWTKEQNKSMIRLFEKPLIEYNLDHAVEAGVNEIIIVVGYKKEKIIQYVGKSYKGIKVRYVVQREQRGLVNAIEIAKGAIEKSDFILMLADEIVVDARIKESVKKFKEEDLFAICGIVFEEDKSSIAKTYSAMVNEKGRVFRLIEKPKCPINNIKGTGHCILRNEIFDCIERTPINANRGEKELVDLIQVAVDDGKKVYVHPISEGYVNVNTKEDYELGKKMIKKSNPRVLIVHTQMKFLGGAELLIVELCNWLTKKGIKNDILSLSKSKEVEDKLIKTEIIIPKHNIDLRPPGFKSAKEILQFINIFRKKLGEIKKNYDVINFHNYPTTWILFPYKKPCVWMLNEPPNLWSRPDARLLLRSINRLRAWIDKKIVRRTVDVICVADEFNKIRCLQRYKRNSRIVYYGVNHDFFSKGDKNKAIKRWSIKDRLVILQSGVISEAKNQLASIKTLKILKDKIPNILLVLAGKEDETYKKKLLEYIKNNKLEKQVLFTGNLNREDLRDLYKAADIGLFPVGKQGGWLAPFELLCSGNPIIVSQELGAASVIKRFNLGIISKNNEEDYADAIIKIYENEESYKKESRIAAEFVKNNLGWDVFTDKMIKAYKEVWKKYTR
jgi:UDP-N-acetylglucosamine diphosphorylase / glucose-1-phosphate thymidylyltransferase / UDP-N-acetylgalactosamine diphosphorylase / glucosamine-1-phosphate N-acetyltransferase / galactosamine-1-phosphate N-acetyltransferase